MNEMYDVGGFNPMHQSRRSRCCFFNSIQEKRSKDCLLLSTGNHHHQEFYEEFGSAFPLKSTKVEGLFKWF